MGGIGQHLDERLRPPEDDFKPRCLFPLDLSLDWEQEQKSQQEKTSYRQMGTFRTYQSPMRLDGAGKRDPRTQFAALPFRRRKSDVEILLASSRDTGRWIIPKGWPMDGKTPAEAAAQEAWEEAGIRGVVSETCAGFYSYMKKMPDGESQPCIVAVFPIEVRRLDEDYPEAGMRKLKWFSLRKAGARVEEPELKRIIRNFSPGKYM